MAYAESTTVPVERSRAELERTLQRYGATAFLYGWGENGRAVIRFRASDRLVRFELSLPVPGERRFTLTAQGRPRAPKAAQEAWEQACRQKLEAVEAGITSFEEEFLAHIELPSGQTMGQWARPHVAAVYESGVQMPALMPA